MAGASNTLSLLLYSLEVNNVGNVCRIGTQSSKIKVNPKNNLSRYKKCTVVKILQIAILLYIFFDTFVIF